VRRKERALPICSRIPLNESPATARAAGKKATVKLKITYNVCLNESPSHRYRIKGKRNKQTPPQTIIGILNESPSAPPAGAKRKERVQEKSSSNVNIDSSMKAHPLVGGEKRKKAMPQKRNSTFLNESPAPPACSTQPQSGKVGEWESNSRLLPPKF
jgi:hypothetical protein